MSNKKYILVVEDEKINRELIHIFLDRLYHLSFAERLDQAVILLNERVYDVIITDIRLGHKLDGIEVLKKVRASKLNKDTPVIAYTASESSVDHKTFFEEGFSGYIAKPVLQSELIAQIESLIKKDPK